MWCFSRISFSPFGIGMFENWPTAIATKVAKTINLMITMADWKCQLLFLSPFLYRRGMLVSWPARFELAMLGQPFWGAATILGRCKRPQWWPIHKEPGNVVFNVTDAASNLGILVLMTSQNLIGFLQISIGNLQVKWVGVTWKLIKFLFLM